MFNLISFFSMLMLGSGLLLGLVVFLRNPKEKKNIYFGVMTLFMVLWLGTSYSIDFINDYKFADLLSRITNASAIISMMFLAAFIMTLYSKKIFLNNIVYKSSLSFVSVVIALLVMFTDFIISGVYLENNIFVNEAGPFYHFMTFYFISSVILVVGLLAVSFRLARGIKKQQVKFVLIGLAIFGFGSLFSNLIIPIFFHQNEFTSVTPILSVFFIGFTAYSIIKHRLMDIRMVVARSLAYAILLFTLAVLYVVAVLGIEKLLLPEAMADLSWTQISLRTSVSVVMVFLFQPIRKWIMKATDKIFFKNQYDPEAVLKELSHTINSTIVLIEMLYKVNDLLINNIKVTRSAFVLFKEESDEPYTSQAIGYKGWPHIDVPDFQHMVRKGIIVYDELDDNSIYKKMLRKYDAAIMMPLTAEGKLIGVYMAGEKNSGDMFTTQDVQIFEIMGPEVAVGITNAKSYEEISKFNVTLRQEVKRATHRLTEKNTQLKELDKAKDEFISMASHQLRTPLTAIKGYLSMLLEGDAGEIKVSQYDFINEAYSAAGRMVGLINDLLNVSRMETGRFFLEPKDVDIERVVDEEVKQLQNHAKEKGLFLKADKKGKIPHIWADETKIRQVVMNFIDNAVYYTQKGGVTVKIRKEKDEFIFEVVDTGIGVPKEQAKHLFEKFFRADNARTTRPDGTGLGIYLAKRVVEDHGGHVIFHSEEGKGSTFGFRFPLKTKAAAKMSSAPTPASTPTHYNNRPTAPALTSAAATYNGKSTGIEPPIATHPEG